ncbi:hypothetical protein H4R24_002006 [Coemansia sp. RSA 988]|nr:hypothetical protein H4R24_002006 [Coemansia sp. RSA 988]
MWPGRPVVCNSSNINSTSSSSSRDSRAAVIADTADDKIATHRHDSAGAVTNGSAPVSIAVNASLLAATVAQMSPSSCTVLIVDRRFLTGVYYTAGNGSPTMRAGPAKDDVVFVQELLEIYGQGKYSRAATAADSGRFPNRLGLEPASAFDLSSALVAVVSGDTALRWIFNHTGNKAIIVLIDIDETFDLGNYDGHTENKHSSNSSDSTLYGPIYTPPTSPQNQQTGAADSRESEGSGPYGLALLRVIAHYVAIGVFRNVAPIATRCTPAISVQRHSLSAAVHTRSGWWWDGLPPSSMAPDRTIRRLWPVAHAQHHVPPWQPQSHTPRFRICTPSCRRDPEPYPIGSAYF